MQKSLRQAGLTIGEAAGRLGLGVHTLRYYEGAGLMAGVDRRPNGHRCYSEDDLQFLDLLHCLRLSGMRIACVRRFSHLVSAGPTTAAERLALLTRHRDAIEDQRRTLDRAAALVDEKLERYREMVR